MVVCKLTPVQPVKILEVAAPSLSPVKPLVLPGKLRLSNNSSIVLTDSTADSSKFKLPTMREAL